jgi:hypothetical protein
MSTFSSYEKDKKIFDNWREFVIKEDTGDKGSLEYSEEDVKKAQRDKKKYIVNSKEEVENLGQLMYFIMSSQNNLRNQVAQAIKSRKIAGLSKFTLGTALAALTGPLGPLFGTLVTDTIVKVIDVSLDRYQVEDGKRGDAPIYKLFDLHDGLKNLIKYHVGDNEMEPVIEQGLMAMIGKLFIKPNPDTWADKTILEVVEKLNAEKLQWQYADEKYGLVQYTPGSDYAKIDTQPVFK